MPSHVAVACRRYRQSATERAACEALIETWAAARLAEDGAVVAVDRQEELGRWYLRLRGDEKDFVTIWLTIRQRTLHHETQVMPAPEVNVARDLRVPLAAQRRAPPDALRPRRRGRRLSRRRDRRSVPSPTTSSTASWDRRWPTSTTSFPPPWPSVSPAATAAARPDTARLFWISRLFLQVLPCSGRQRSATVDRRTTRSEIERTGIVRYD